MNNNQVVHGESLGSILKTHIDEKLKDIRLKYRKIAKGELDFTPIEEPRKKRRETLKSILVGKETIKVEFPEDCRHFTGIDDVLLKCGDWNVDVRKRVDQQICDMQYTHESSKGKQFRSVVDVVNFLLPEGYPKLQSKRTKIKEIGDTSENITLEVGDANVVPAGDDSESSRKKRRKREFKVKEENSKKMEKILLGSSCVDKKIDDENAGNNSIQSSPILQEDSMRYELIRWEVHCGIIDEIQLEDMFKDYAYNHTSISTEDNEQNKDLPTISEVVSILEKSIDKSNRKIFCIQPVEDKEIHEIYVID